MLNLNMVLFEQSTLNIIIIISISFIKLDRQREAGKLLSACTLYFILHWSDMYWSEARNLMNCGDLITSTSPVLLTSKCPQALAK